MSSIMLMRLQELCKNCARLVRRSAIFFYCILTQSGKILAQFLCTGFISFHLILSLLQMCERLYCVVRCFISTAK